MLISLGGASLRSYRPEDAPQLARYANDADVAAYQRETAARRYTVDDAAAWIALVSAQTPECHFSIACEDTIIGGIALELQTDVYAHSAELSYWIAPAHWGRGHATRAVGALTDHAFVRLGLTRLYARVFDGNAASRRVLEKCAYRLEGRLQRAALKDGVYFDQSVYAALRAQH